MKVVRRWPEKEKVVLEPGHYVVVGLQDPYYGNFLQRPVSAIFEVLEELTYEEFLQRVKNQDFNFDIIGIEPVKVLQ